MNLLADESVDRQIVDWLRRNGHEVLYIAELAPGIFDEAVLEQANQLNAVLLTADKDFGELVYRRGQVHAGVILLRLAGVMPEAKAAILSTAIARYSSELIDAFSVVTAGTVRIRRKI
jgi:predicted nuclease of predicted toxin-antitoxin system